VSLLLQGGKALVDGAIRDADVVVAEGVFTWIGTSGHAPATDHVARLDGALLLPAFVDGHVHATDTGLTLAGLDLTGVRSKQELLDAVAARTKDLRGRTILGHGWDETAWPDRSLPTADELDRAAYGSYVYLSRVDVHSALASGALMASVPGLAALDGFSTSGWLAREAHHAVRTAGLGSLSAAQRQEAHRIMLRTAAERGIAQVHEMAGPLISGEEDTRLLLELAASDEPLPEVVAYWGQLASEGGLETMRRLARASMSPIGTTPRIREPPTSTLSRSPTTSVPAPRQACRVASTSSVMPRRPLSPTACAVRRHAWVPTRSGERAIAWSMRRR